ncbi:MAG: hypothetical protein IJB91_03675 [Oscillospiraceae bacterium]|nr:hypothetical protein [Oscillospiraceae bacterium]
MANEKLLIDVKKLITDIQGTISEVARTAPYDPDWFTRIAQRQHEILTIIEKQPTVDAVEVVHGYWIDSHTVDHVGRIIKHGIDCSVCENVFKDDSREVVKRWKERFTHCPFCGAKMDGGNEDV